MCPRARTHADSNKVCHMGAQEFGEPSAHSCQRILLDLLSHSGADTSLAQKIDAGVPATSARSGDWRKRRRYTFGFETDWSTTGAGKSMGTLKFHPCYILSTECKAGPSSPEFGRRQAGHGDCYERGRSNMHRRLSWQQRQTHSAADAFGDETEQTLLVLLASLSPSGHCLTSHCSHPE